MDVIGNLTPLCAAHGEYHEDQLELVCSKRDSKGPELVVGIAHSQMGAQIKICVTFSLVDELDSISTEAATQ